MYHTAFPRQSQAQGENSPLNPIRSGPEISMLFVDPCFQNRGIGAALLNFAVEVHRANVLWALEKNVRAIRFYERHGFHVTDEKILEEGTTEYLVRLRRDSGNHP